MSAEAVRAWFPTGTGVVILLLAVAFAEDRPVLFFSLAGVLCLINAVVAVSQGVAEYRRQLHRCRVPSCPNYGDPDFGEATCPAAHARRPRGDDGYHWRLPT